MRRVGRNQAFRLAGAIERRLLGRLWAEVTRGGLVSLRVPRTRRLVGEWWLEAFAVQDGLAWRLRPVSEWPREVLEAAELQSTA